MVDGEFLSTVRRALLERRGPSGHWEGHLSSSALATATAVTALAVAGRAAGDGGDAGRISRGLRWLVDTQNPDGGWGDTTDSVSNISTTALVWAALAFGRGTDVDAAAAAADGWLARGAGGSNPERLAAALGDRYGKDRTFSVPILTMCAIAGRLGSDAGAWRLVPQLPFELAALPQRSFGAMRLPVVSYALPALIAMGLARHRKGPRIRLVSGVRERLAPRVLTVLERLQPSSGGFLEAVPLTSFVAMSLSAAGEGEHRVVRDGLRFLRRTARDDGSWAIDSNLATWVTTLSVDALASGDGLAEMTEAERSGVVTWLLDQQCRTRHAYTGAAPGGWAWTHLPGGVPDADDTAGALVALAHLRPRDARVHDAALAGVQWLIDLQNRDGGIPTFCRGWGTLPFDRSAVDLTAHAIRAWRAWRPLLRDAPAARVDRATARAVAYLARCQRTDGAFIPLWFGNQAEAREENPVFGTGRVLKALAALPRTPTIVRMQARAVHWSVGSQNPDGGWGGAPRLVSSIEETGAAVAGLAAAAGEHPDDGLARALCRGLRWLVEATGNGRRFSPSPIGMYFARLWYSEELYPLIFTTAAVEAVAVRARGAAGAVPLSGAQLRPDGTSSRSS